MRSNSVGSGGTPDVSSPAVFTFVPNVFNEDVYCSFFLDRFFSFGAWNEELQYNRSWMWSALQDPSQSPVSNLAIRSLVRVFFGNANHHLELANTALELHGRTLRAVKQTINGNAGNVSFDILSAIILVGFYESCHLTYPTAWIDHLSGAKLLFQIKGPQFFQNRPAKSLLMFCRYTLVTAAIISRKRCFLEEPEWRDALQSDVGVYACTIQLGNLSTSLPGILEDVKNLQTTDPSDDAFQPHFESIFQQFLSQFDGLAEWWESWTSDPQRLPQCIEINENLKRQIDELYPAGIPPTSLGTKAPSVLRFNSLETAAGHCRYHAHFLILVNWLNRLLLLQNSANITDGEELVQRGFNLAKADDKSSIDIVDAADLIPHAHAICEILPTYSLPHYRHVGAIYMGLPARVAWANLPRESPYVSWIERFIELMADSSGFSMPRSILRDIKLNG